MKNIIEDIKRYIDSEAVKNKIALDLGLKIINVYVFYIQKVIQVWLLIVKRKNLSALVVVKVMTSLIIIKNITINHS